jgi:hypothetical protein
VQPVAFLLFWTSVLLAVLIQFLDFYACAFLGGSSQRQRPLPETDNFTYHRHVGIEDCRADLLVDQSAAPSEGNAAPHQRWRMRLQKPHTLGM